MKPTPESDVIAMRATDQDISDICTPAKGVAEIAARLDRLPPSRTIWTMIVLISLGGVFEYYDLLFTGYVAPGMIQSGLFKPESLAWLAKLQVIAMAGFGTFVFATFAGLWVGTLVVGYVADRWGRRKVFTWSLIWYVLASAIMSFQNSGYELDIWRFIASIGIGVELVTISSYISELIPGNERGRAYAVSQMITFSAVPVVAFFAYALKDTRPLGLDYWRVVILIGTIGAGLVWILRRHVPESPRWLATHGRIEEADRIVSRIERAVMKEQGLTSLPPAQSVDIGIEMPGSLRDIFGPLYRKRTLILSIFNAAQVVGYFGFSAWVPMLLIGRGIHVTQSLAYAFVIAIANPFGSMLGVFIADKCERKLQVCASLLVMGGVIAAFSQSSSPVALTVLGVVFTLASNTMTYSYVAYMAELYPTRVRARAVGFVYSWSRISGAFVGLAVGYLLHEYGVPGVAIFICVSIVVAIWAILLVPNTRGRSLEQISH